MKGSGSNTWLRLVEFLVQQHDLQFRLEVHLVVMLGAHAVLFGLPVVGHQDDGRLDGSEHRKK